MTGRDPFAAGSLLKRLRNIGESDRQRAGEFGGRLVSELADRAVLIGCMLLVAETSAAAAPATAIARTTIHARQLRLRRASPACARPL